MSKIFVLCIALFFGGLILIQLQTDAYAKKHNTTGITFQVEAFSTVKGGSGSGSNSGGDGGGIDRISLEESMMPKNSNEWGAPYQEPFYTKNNATPGKTTDEAKPVDPAAITGYCRVPSAQ